MSTQQPLNPYAGGEAPEESDSLDEEATLVAELAHATMRGLFSERERKRVDYIKFRARDLAEKAITEAVERVAKHEGPGPHPGTGTEQEVHAGGLASGVGQRLTREQRLELGILPPLVEGKDFKSSLLNAVKTLRRRHERRLSLMGEESGIEEMYVIDKSGKEKLRKIGNADGIDFSIADGIKVWDSYMVHTHPAFKPTQRLDVQTPLSDGDVLSALIHGTRGVMAVAPDAIYSMKVHVAPDDEDKRREVADFFARESERIVYPRLLTPDLSAYRDDVTGQDYFDAVTEVQRRTAARYPEVVTFSRALRGQSVPSRALSSEGT